MITHKDRQLGKKVMQSTEGLMISKSRVCPSKQPARSTTRSRGSEACERSDELKERVMPQYVMMNKL